MSEVLRFKCKQKLRGFPEDKQSNRRKVLIRNFPKKLLKMILAKTNPGMIRVKSP